MQDYKKLPDHFYVNTENGKYSDEIMNFHAIPVNKNTYRGFNNWKFVEVGAPNVDKLNVTNRRTDGTLPLFTYEHWKKLTTMENTTEERKIIGYTLIKKEYKDASEAIMKVKWQSGDKLTVTVSDCIKRLNDAGVLDLWYKPIYEEVDKSFTVVTGNRNDKIVVHKSGAIDINNGKSESNIPELRGIVNKISQVDLDLGTIGIWDTYIVMQSVQVRVGCLDENHLFSYSDLYNIILKFDNEQWDN